MCTVTQPFHYYQFVCRTYSAIVFQSFWGKKKKKLKFLHHFNPPFPSKGVFSFLLKECFLSSTKPNTYIMADTGFRSLQRKQWTDCLSDISVLKPLQPKFTVDESLNRQQHTLGAYVLVCMLVPAHQQCVPAEQPRASITASADDAI